MRDGALRLSAPTHWWSTEGAGFKARDRFMPVFELPGPGRHAKLPHPRQVGVVGGGLAGLACAIALAEKGAKVLLFEKEPYLGGRLGSWQDTLENGESFEMERGFHAFFRQYYNLRTLLKRIDPQLSMLKPLHDYPVLGPHGHRESFTGLPSKAPWNMIAMTWRSPTLKLRDLPGIDRDTALEMLRFEPQHTYQSFDHLSAKDYLDQLRFPARARQMLFDVFSHSFFNPEANMSAAELLMMFHFYFIGNPEGLIFDICTRPFGPAIVDPLARYFQSLGGQIHHDCEVSHIESHERGYTIHSNKAPESCQWLALALHVPALRRVVEHSPTLGRQPWRQQVASLELTEPFAVWRLWLSGPMDPTRTPFAGTVGLGLLDNISLYHLIEDESRAWAQRTGGSVVELHAYGVPPSLDRAQIQDDLLRGFHSLYPEAKHHQVLHERWLYRRDCPAFAPGSHAMRPKVNSSTPSLVLAGDHCKLPLPSALMERAVMSGFLAANHLLAQDQVRPVPIRAVRARGWLAPKSPPAPSQRPSLQ